MTEVVNENKLRWKDGIPYIPEGKVYRRAYLSECLFCGRMFWHRKRSGEDAKRPKRLSFCSRECAGRDRRKMWSSRQEMKRCAICLRFFRKRPSDRQKTCGRPECLRKQRSRASKAHWDSIKVK